MGGTREGQEGESNENKNKRLGDKKGPTSNRQVRVSSWKAHGTTKQRKQVEFRVFVPPGRNDKNYANALSSHAVSQCQGGKRAPELRVLRNGQSGTMIGASNKYGGLCAALPPRMTVRLCYARHAAQLRSASEAWNLGDFCISAKGWPLQTGQ